MVEDHVVEEPKYNYEIGLWGFYFGLFNECVCVCGGGGG